MSEHNTQGQVNTSRTLTRSSRHTHRVYHPFTGLAAGRALRSPGAAPARFCSAVFSLRGAAPNRASLGPDPCCAAGAYTPSSCHTGPISHTRIIQRDPPQPTTTPNQQPFDAVEQLTASKQLRRGMAPATPFPPLWLAPQGAARTPPSARPGRQAVGWKQGISLPPAPISLFGLASPQAVLRQSRSLARRPAKVTTPHPQPAGQPRSNPTPQRSRQANQTPPALPCDSC